MTTAHVRIEDNGDGFWFVHADKPGILPWENSQGWARLTRQEAIRLLRKLRPAATGDDIDNALAGPKVSWRVNL